MEKKVTAFIQYNSLTSTSNVLKDLGYLNGETELIDTIYLLSSKKTGDIQGCKTLETGSIYNTKTLQIISGYAKTDYILLFLEDSSINLGQFALERFFQVAEKTGAGILYSDYYETKEGKRTIHPVIDYQPGSLRDEFDFGPVLFIKTESLKKAVQQINEEYNFAGVYDLRLRISQNYPIIRIPEFLYTISRYSDDYEGEHFAYVDPKNREVQVEMEKAVTDHLKKIGAYLKPEFEKVNLDEQQFEVEASVIIPVKNRDKTISDAVNSVLKQRAGFNFNIIIVDNYSNDGTTKTIKSFSEKDSRIIHVIPERQDLGIGGCWNVAVHHPECGRFSVQLDSDDIYKDENTLQLIVNKFRAENVPMVIGSYTITDFNFNEIPPGLIDHKEWTPENGRNNALRINGLGAPRAFYTPLIRKIKIPNTSYGEDYAVGLEISRNYQIARIYEPIYFCRRWGDNTEAQIDIAKLNIFNLYKDRLRTFEIKARQRKNYIS
jgi:hypothetical protein